MGQIFRVARVGDVVLAGGLTIAGAILMIANIETTDEGVRIDSRSWLMLPVFAAVTLPVLWRRRSMVAVLTATAAALAVHVAAFDWVVRCGVGLPLSLALAYGAGRLMDVRSGALGFVAVLGIQALVLVRDSAAGFEVMPATGVVGAGFWGAGVWLRSRSVAERRSERVPVASYL